MDIKVNRKGRVFEGTVNGTSFVGKLQYLQLIGERATPDECVPAIGPAKPKGGYQVTWNGTGGQSQHGVSRALYEGMYEMPNSRRTVAAHTCDNIDCVNPHHVQFVSREIVEQQKIANGKGNRGSKHAQSALDDEQRAEVCRLYDTGDYTQAKLAEMFGVSQATINRIINEPQWPIIPMTEETAAYAYRLAWSTKYSIRAIAEHVGAMPTAVYSIKTGESWSHVTGYFSSEMYSDKINSEAK
jgi:predicted DNA-binding protein (UPF0251 family)